MNQNSNNRRPAPATSSHYSTRQYFRDNLRVLRKNLLFSSGLPLSLTEDDIRSDYYFGKYGTVTKVIMLRNIRQMSVYVTYSDVYEASLAIIQKATNDFEVDRYHKLASIYGTIKYCKYFLKKIQCKNMPNCNYLHVHDKKNEIYIDNQLPDQVFQQHYSIALRLLKQISPNKMIKDKNLLENTEDDILPCPIEALERISKEKISGPSKYESSGPQSCESCSDSQCSRSVKTGSEEQTSETIVPQTFQTPTQKEDFPKLSTVSQPIIHKQPRYKQKQKLQSPSRSKQKLLQPQPHQQNPHQTLEIKLIRKLVREPRSKLNEWTDFQSNNQQTEQINFFHKQLSQLNQLREICEINILKQINRQEERLKFLLIKNIHHKKHHHHHKEHHHENAEKHYHSKNCGAYVK